MTDRDATIADTAIERIVAARSAGEVVAGTRLHCTSVEALAASFGLKDAAGTYDLVMADEARAVLETVIHKDMAYGCEIVSRASAAELSDAFIEAFPAATTRFFTNGSFGRPVLAAGMGAGWQPATDATFDTGVLALGVPLSACVWIKDED